MAPRIYWIWLSQKEGITPLLIAQLLDRAGTPEFLYGADRDQLCALGLNLRQVNALCDKDLRPAEEILRRCDAEGIQIIALGDSAYPQALRMIDDPPPVLYVRGTLPDLTRAPGLTIVGTRKATPYGLRMAHRFGAGLAKAGFTVVSGLALGADAAAAAGALRAGGRTIAVLAGGVDICYPPQNRALMGDILLSGAVISENPPGTGNEGFRFPIRNRILSGLSTATLVVEASERSGALITAHRALEQGREVFAVPGALDAPLSVGCNRLIAEGAHLALSPFSILRELEGSLRDTPAEDLIRTVWERETGPDCTLEAPEAPQEAVRVVTPRETLREIRSAHAPAAPAAESKPSRLSEETLAQLSDEERVVAELVAGGANCVDEIVQETGFSAAQATTLLTLLELSGVVRRVFDRYTLIE